MLVFLISRINSARLGFFNVPNVSVSPLRSDGPQNHRAFVVVIQTTLILVSLSFFNVIISRLNFECPLTFLFHPLTWFRLVLYQDLNLISVCMASKS